MISIRRQLTRELLGAVLLLLGVGSAALYLAARDATTDQFDAALEAKARAVSTLTLRENGGVRIAFSDRFMPGFEDRTPRDFFQMWDAEGREIARSESLRTGAQLPRRVGTLQKPAEWDFTLPNGRPGRAVGFTFRLKSAETNEHSASAELQLVVASDREDLDETLWQLLGLCVGLAVLLVGATLWLIPSVLRRGLAPLERLGEHATRIDAGSLSSRFTFAQLPLELQPIAQRLNDLLARLEESFERERRFSADLAHELRTPLAELRSLVECALKWPESRDPHLDRDALAIAQQMERIVTHTLALARGEQGQLAVRIEPVDLRALVDGVWPAFARRAAERRLGLEMNLPPCEADADADLLRSILTNLIENAADYAAPGGTIRIRTEGRADGIAITVGNPVSDLAREDLPRLFDRFWRKESARSGGLHLGLGLSLARSFARAMRWNLSARFDDRGDLVFTLEGAGRMTDSKRVQAAEVDVRVI